MWNQGLISEGKKAIRQGVLSVPDVGCLAKHVQRSGLTLDELLTRYLNVAIVVETGRRAAGVFMVPAG